MDSCKCPECKKLMDYGFIFSVGTNPVGGGAPGIMWKGDKEDKITCLTGREVRPQSVDAYRCAICNIFSFNYVSKEMKTSQTCPECEDEMKSGYVFPIDDITDVKIWWKDKFTGKEECVEKNVGEKIFPKGLLEFLAGIERHGSPSTEAFLCNNCKVLTAKF